MDKMYRKIASVEKTLLAMVKPGYFIPLEYTCGAVLDCNYVRLQDPVMGRQTVTGKISAEDYPDRKPATITIPLSDIVWISSEPKETK